MGQMLSASEFRELLDRHNPLSKALRPETDTPVIAGYECYFKDPRGGITDESPPSILTKESELLTIDEYLGIYIPLTRQIKVFKQNIEIAAAMLDCQEDDLTHIVQFHEHAHAAIHLGVNDEERTKGILNAKFRRSRLQSLNKAFARIEPFLQEHLAQLVTYHVLRTLSDASQEEIVYKRAHRMLDVFSRLMRRQPPAYRIDPYLEVPLERLQGTIQLMRKEYLVGKVVPWREIMSWK